MITDRILHESQSVVFLNYLIWSAIGHKQNWHQRLFKCWTWVPILLLPLLFPCSVYASLTHARNRWVSNENKPHMKCLPRQPEQFQTCSSAGRINTIPPEDFGAVMVATTLYPLGPKSPRVHLRLDPLPAMDTAHDSNPFSSLSDPPLPAWKHLHLLCFPTYLFWACLEFAARPPFSKWKQQSPPLPSNLLSCSGSQIPACTLWITANHQSVNQQIFTGHDGEGGLQFCDTSWLGH